MPLSPETLLPFQSLPDTARQWLLPLDPPTEASRIAPALETALAAWRHKGVQYQAAWTLLEGRILAIAEPSLAEAPSGCAIDGMLRTVHRIAEAAGLTVADAQAVVARTEGGLRLFSRSELEARLADGTLQDSTSILDLALYTLGDLRQGRLEKPLAMTWIGRKYKRQAPAGTGA
ncbi:MAG TPA: hypothetical protein VF768_02845 [Holophagaceae bacterium]